MSALIRPEIRAPVVVEPRTYDLVIYADVQVRVNVAHDGESDGRVVHRLTLDAGLSPFAAQQGAEMRVIAPAQPFTHPAQEPDDNSFAARTLRMAHATLPRTLSSTQVWAFTYAFFTLWPDQEHFVLASDECTWREALLASGMAIPHPTSVAGRTWRTHGPLVVSRAAFWQGAGPLGPTWWAPFADGRGTFAMAPSTYKHVSDGTAPAALHPTRPPLLATDAAVVYRRYVPELAQTLTFRLARSSSDADVDLLHKWHATDRVNTGWRQNMPREAHKKYLEDQEASSESLALIGEWDGQPFGYMEVYYAKESSLRTYYDAGDYDRGFHALVGEERFRGAHRVRTWMGSLVHMLFLLDPRTMRVVSEPRASNTKMVEYECLCGGHVEKVRYTHLTNNKKLIDFPHKRAALVFIPRERFFQLCPLGPLPQRT